MKKNIFATLLLAILLPVAAMADSYTSLWKKYDAAVRKDYPQTVQKILSQISAKAEKERAYGHLLKAQIAATECAALVSLDSLQPAVERLKRYEQAAEQGGNHVLAAIYQSVLGKIYTTYDSQLDDAKAQARYYFARSMAYPDALAAAYSTGYEPFVVDGIDSKYYYDDMLHIIGIAAADYQRMHDYYATHGKREGACLTALQIVKAKRHYADQTRVKKSKYIQSLDSLISEYGDLVVCGEVAIARYEYMKNADDVTAEEKNNYINYALTKWGAWTRMNILRNAQRRLTLPSFHALIGGEMALPGVPRKVVVMSATNIGELRLTASRLDITDNEKFDLSNDKDYARLRRRIVTTEAPITDTRRYVGLPAYKTVSDTLELPGLRSGFYLVELSTDNLSVPTERHILRVCNIYPLVEVLPGDKYRFAVVDATTGKAMPGARIQLYYAKGNREERDDYDVQTYLCDSNGEVYVDCSKRRPTQYRIATDSEQAFPLTPINGRFYYNNNRSVNTQTQLYTDRRIYRPGQTVHVAAIAYKYDCDAQRGEVQKGQTLTVTLRDADRKEVAKQTVTTDDFGMASLDFALPEGGKNGVYTLRSDYGNNTLYNFSVEEYKRPTFGVEIAKATERYALGDTVRLAAKAATFAGMPVQGAKVAVKVVRRPALFWRFAADDVRTEMVYNDTTLTDNMGAFTVRVPIRVPETYDEHPSRYYSFDITADVTDASGETQHAEVALPYSDRPTMFTCDMPKQVLADSLRTITFAYLNNAGEPVAGDVTYVVDGVRYTCKANEPAKFDGKSLASARHSLVAYCGTDTLTQSFVTFTLQDRRSPVDTHDWFYISARRFQSKSTPVFVQVGSSDSIQHVVYTVIAGNKIVEDGRADLRNGEVSTRSLFYKEEWGDGITLSLAWVKNGTAYQHTESIARPEPNTRLQMTWTTFRDRLVPGQQETWTLHIAQPDGKPAKAQLLATLYDKSLDALRQHSVSFRLPTYDNIPWLAWKTFYNNRLFAYSEMPVRFLNENDVKLSHFYDPYNMLNSRLFFAIEEKACGTLCERSVKALAKIDRQSSNSVGGFAAPEASAAEDDAADAGAADNNTTATVQLRENLNETAFFYPGVATDEKGNVSLQFTLPESVTTWQFYGLAHDEQMNSSTLAATAVAKKTVMIQPNVPRFVRPADKGVLSARISNTAEKQVSGTARLAMLNPETNREVWHKDVKFVVNPNETKSVDFDFDMAKIANDGMLVCRVTASGRGFSDGEQHYLPVLSDEELVTNTIAFTQNEAGTLNIDVAKLFPVADKRNSLTVEYTNSPEWLLMQALPTMAQPEGDNAVSLATAYYANSLTRHLVASSEAAKRVMSTWKKEGTSGFDEAQINKHLLDILSRLSSLQNADGSFSWWKGMNGSAYMTMNVLTTLARLDKMVGVQPETREMMNAAFRFMDRQMADEVKELKQLHTTHTQNLCPSELAIDYLYATTLTQRQMKKAAKDNADYLIALLAKQNSALSIYGKSVAAVVLAGNKHAAEAADLAKSISQYTVFDERVGRYFDTPKALYSWRDYRIPSQVAAIEALQTVRPSDVQTIGEMKQWLLQAKRTQSWETPINAANAVYAFFGGDCSKLAADKPQAVLRINGRQIETSAETDALGYVKATQTGDKLKTLSVEKSTSGTSWGAVYAQFVQPTADVADAAEGMSVVREVMKNGKRLASEGEMLAVGDRITVRLTIKAERDYDFVQLSDRRAACLESVAQLSGYRNGYYCEPKDNVTNYFFDRMPKGKHVVETEYYVDRAGTYQTGTCSVQCTYSPAFCGRTKAIELNTKQK